MLIHSSLSGSKRTGSHSVSRDLWEVVIPFTSRCGVLRLGIWGYHKPNNTLPQLPEHNRHNSNKAACPQAIILAMGTTTAPRNRMPTIGIVTRRQERLRHSNPRQGPQPLPRKRRARQGYSRKLP